MDLRNLPPIDGASFIDLSFSIKNRGKVPSACGLTGEEEFADIEVAYSPEGIALFLNFYKPFEDCYYPEFTKGDGVEIFIDTRGIFGAQTIHKYCHHFLFLPEEKNGFQAGEITRFRSEDKHELADVDLFTVASKFTSKKHQMEIMIPESALFGFDPYEYPRIGFAYKIHRVGGLMQSFPLSSTDYKIESIPSLWSKILLEEK